MQTFLPYPDFVASARCLDRLRLGKQRLEVLQILRAIRHDGVTTGRWRNHPAIRMWVGFRPALALYGLVICDEWIRRGYRDNCRPLVQIHFTLDAADRWGLGAADKLDEWNTRLIESWLASNELPLPPWFGRQDFHASHRAALLAKYPEHYGRPELGWTEEPIVAYVWP